MHRAPVQTRTPMRTTRARRGVAVVAAVVLLALCGAVELLPGRVSAAGVVVDVSPELGRAGGALYLSTAAQRMVSRNISAGAFATTELTASFWVRHNVPNIIFGFPFLWKPLERTPDGDAPGDPLISMHLYATSYDLVVGPATSGWRASWASPINDAGVWRHLTVTWRSSGADNGSVLYEDGVMNSGGRQLLYPGYALPTTVGRLHIGEKYNGEDSITQFDEITVWRRVLSLGEQTALRLHPNSMAGASVTGLIVRYTFDDFTGGGGGSTAADVSGNGFDATLLQGDPVPTVVDTSTEALVASRAPHWGSATNTTAVVVGVATWTLVVLAGGGGVAYTGPAPVIDTLPAAALLYQVTGTLTSPTRGAPISAPGTAVTSPVYAVWVETDGSFAADDTFAYTATAAGASLPTDVQQSQVVLRPNSPPVSASFAVSVDEDRTLRFELCYVLGQMLTLDVMRHDRDGPVPLQAYVLSVPSKGVLTQDDGTPITAATVVTSPYAFVQYTPGLHESGPTYASFDYLLSDGHTNSSSPYTVTLHVIPFHYAPVGDHQNVTLVEDHTTNVTLTTTRIEPDEPLLRITQLPQHGTLRQLNEDGTVGAVITSGSTTGALQNLQQWVTACTGSSAWSDPTGGWDFAQVIGPPNAFPAYGDNVLAWAAAQTGTPEWLHLTFDTPVYVTGIDIYETFKVGHTVAVSALDARGHWRLLWSGDVDAVAGNANKARIFSPPVCPTQIRTRAIRIDLAAAGDSWAEIDAVMLRGVTALDPSIVTNLDGRVQYVPDAHFDATDRFEFLANDCVYYNNFRDSFLSPAAVRVTMVPVNNAPVIVAPPPASLIVGLPDAVIPDGATTLVGLSALSLTGELVVAINGTDVDDDVSTGVVYRVVQLPDAGRLFALVTTTTSGSSDTVTARRLITASMLPYALPGPAADNTAVAAPTRLVFALDEEPVCFAPQVSRSITVVLRAQDAAGAQSPPTVFTITALCGRAPFTASGGLRYALLALAVVGVVGAAVVLGLVLWYRATRVMLASSPKLCALCLGGCVLLYATCITLVPYPPTAALCVLQPLMGHAGFTLVFASLLAKNYRLMKIFGNANNFKRYTMSDARLIGLVGAVLSGVLLYLVVWFAVDPPVPTHSESDNSSTRSFHTRCQSSQSFWSLVPIFLDAVAMLFGVYVVFQTRNNPTLLNESKQIGLSLYNISFIALVVLPLVFLLLDNPDTSMLLMSLGLWFCTTVVVAAIFGPKFLHLYAESHGTHHDVTAGANPDGTATTRPAAFGLTTLDPTAHTGATTMFRTSSAAAGAGALNGFGAPAPASPPFGASTVAATFSPGGHTRLVPVTPRVANPNVTPPGSRGGTNHVVTTAATFRRPSRDTLQLPGGLAAGAGNGTPAGGGGGGGLVSVSPSPLGSLRDSQRRNTPPSRPNRTSLGAGAAALNGAANGTGARSSSVTDAQKQVADAAVALQLVELQRTIARLDAENARLRALVPGASAAGTGVSGGTSPAGLADPSQAQLAGASPAAAVASPVQASAITLYGAPTPLNGTTVVGNPAAPMSPASMAAAALVAGAPPPGSGTHAVGAGPSVPPPPLSMANNNAWTALSADGRAKYVAPNSPPAAAAAATAVSTTTTTAAAMLPSLVVAAPGGTGPASAGPGGATTVAAVAPAPNAALLNVADPQLPGSASP